MFFALLLFSHIIYVYLYYDADEIAKEGWSVSEGIIGDFPDLNPLKGSSDYNKNIISLLYRSLMNYDYKEKKMTGDLANCNIENLARIECTIKPGTYWSNGKPISTDDILSTFNVLKNSDINPAISALLQGTEIEEKDGIIIFKNVVQDISFLSVLMQPIASKDILDNIGNKELFGKFNPVDGVYSGPYRVDTVSYDDSLWLQKLILVKNEKYTEKNILISKYIIKFFKDTVHFNKQKDNVSVFFDQNQVLNDSIPRLQEYDYTLNKFSAVFLNESRIRNIDLRGFILDKIDRKQILSALWDGFNEVKNPFLSEKWDTQKVAKNQNIESIMKSLWYYKKAVLEEKLAKKEVIPAKPEIPKETLKTESGTTTEPKLIFIKGPFTTLNTMTEKDDILVEGTTLWKKVTAVYINDYKLSGYKAGNTSFYYRLKESYKTIKKWENTYTVSFMINGVKKQMEVFHVYYGTKKEESALQPTNEWTGEVIKEAIPLAQSGTTSSGGTNSGTTTTSSGKVNAVTLSLEDKRSKLAVLDDEFYYDSDLKKFTLRCYYIDSQQEYAQVVNIIKSSLETYGIAVEAIPMSMTDLNEKMVNDEKDYDLILAGIDLGFYDFNIYSYFHSGQAKWGYNFSSIREQKLDQILGSLKSQLFPAKKQEEMEQQAINLLRDEQIIKTLYSKDNVVYIDKNIRNITIASHYPSPLGITQSILDSYVVSDKTIQFAHKWFSNFVSFIFWVFKNGWELKK